MAALGGFHPPLRAESHDVAPFVPAHLRYDSLFPTPSEVRRRDLSHVLLSPVSPRTCADGRVLEDVTALLKQPFRFRRAFGRAEPTCRTFSLKAPPPSPPRAPLPREEHPAPSAKEIAASAHTPYMTAFAYPSASPSPRPAAVGLNVADATSPRLSLLRGSPRERHAIGREAVGGCGGPWPIPSRGWPVPPKRASDAPPPLSGRLRLSEEVYEEWARCVEGAEGAPSYLVVGYDASEGDTREKLVLLGSGAGGFFTLRPLIDRFTVTYGVFKVICEGSPRWIFVCCVGKSSGTLVKDAAESHWREAASQFKGISMAMRIDEEEQLQTHKMIQRLEKKLRGKVHLDPSYKEWHALFYQDNLAWEARRRHLATQIGDKQLAAVTSPHVPSWGKAARAHNLVGSTKPADVAPAASRSIDESWESHPDAHHSDSLPISTGK